MPFLLPAASDCLPRVDPLAALLGWRGLRLVDTGLVLGTVRVVFVLVGLHESSSSCREGRLRWTEHERTQLQRLPVLGLSSANAGVARLELANHLPLGLETPEMTEASALNVLQIARPDGFQSLRSLTSRAVRWDAEKPELSHARSAREVQRLPRTGLSPNSQPAAVKAAYPEDTQCCRY